MGYGKSDVRVTDLPVERAETDCALGILYGPRSLTGVAEDNRTQTERPSGRARQLQRAVDRVHRGLVIVVDQADCEPRSRQRPSIVGAGLDCGTGMVQRGG